MASDPTTTPAGTQTPPHQYNYKPTYHLPNWVIRRINRRPRYPPPADQFFHKTEMGKLFLTGAVISLLSAPASYHNLNLIFEGCMYNLIIADCWAIWFLISALYLQDYPEVAVLSMILGSLLMIGAVHAIMFSVLPEGMRWPVLVAFSGYVVVLCFVLYRIFKDDVRVREEEDEDEYCKDRGVDQV